MKKELFREIEVPEGVETSVDKDIFTVKGSEGELSRKFKLGKLTLEKKNNKIIIGEKKATKTEKRLMNTIASHIENMIKGVQEKFEYKMKICFSHFPITVEIKDKEAIIKNFLGEKIPRKTKILDNVDIKIDKDIITIQSSSKELAGQTAANLEKSTKVRARDRRVFQDGLFITNKAGNEI